MKPGWGRRSKPWEDEEYIFVNDVKCVYTITEGKTWIALPGQPPMTIAQLQGAGYRIVEPVRWRVEQTKPDDRPESPKKELRLW